MRVRASRPAINWPGARASWLPRLVSSVTGDARAPATSCLPGDRRVNAPPPRTPTYKTRVNPSPPPLLGITRRAPPRPIASALCPAPTPNPIALSAVPGDAPTAPLRRPQIQHRPGRRRRPPVPAPHSRCRRRPRPRRDAGRRCDAR